LDSPLIQDATKLYIQDVYDHTIQAIDTIESFRDITSGMLDIYLSNISQRMNEIMKVLTIVATIFVPLTFIASVFGMNFEYFPELHWKWGYPLSLLLMLGVGLSMLYYFKRKGWLKRSS
jgi:magnesium transporter